MHLAPPPSAWSPSCAPPLREGAVHLWRMPLDGPAAGHDALSCEERARGERFVHERDGHRFRQARAHLRTVLALYCGADAARLDFRSGPHGKPALAEPHAWLRFNLSHSGGWMLLALARDREVGVDLEAMRGEIDFESIAAECFQPEEANSLRHLPAVARTARFYALWTAHEAGLKARGTGFLEPGAPAGWAAYPVPAPEGFAAAVAVAGAKPQLECRTWLN